MFAKIFDTEYGQVVVMKQEDEAGDPEIRFCCQPENANTCSLAYAYTKEEDRDRIFLGATSEWAQFVAAEINKYLE